MANESSKLVGLSFDFPIGIEAVKLADKPDNIVEKISLVLITIWMLIGIGNCFCLIYRVFPFFDVVHARSKFITVCFEFRG
jgi:hypothetical protein